MSLFSCPDCGTQVSTSAHACPRCARPFQAYYQHPPQHHVTNVVSTKRAGGVYELAGFAVILLGMGSCTVGYMSNAGPPDSFAAFVHTAFVYGGWLLAAGGLTVFMSGRFM